jgi:hypothetical protein
VVHTHTHPLPLPLPSWNVYFSVLAPLFQMMVPTSHICWHTCALDCQSWCQYRSLYNGQGTDSNSVEKSTSSEACNSPANLDVPQILWNHIHKNLLLLHILCHSIKSRKSRDIESCYKIWWKKGIRYTYLINISSNTCTLWYTIFDMCQLLHFGTEVLSLGSHYNKGTGDGQNNGNSCERYTYLY